MTYKKSMMYGIYAMGLSQSLGVVYAYSFNNAYELGSAGILASILSIIVMAIFGVIPGALLHLIYKKFNKISAKAIGSFLFITLLVVSYLATEEVKESNIEILFAIFTYLLSGILMGHLYNKNVTSVNEST